MRCCVVDQVLRRLESIDEGWMGRHLRAGGGKQRFGIECSSTGTGIAIIKPRLLTSGLAPEPLPTAPSPVTSMSSPELGS